MTPNPTDPSIRELLEKFRNGTINPDPKKWAMHPEDALCQLAIELFEQGILKKEEHHE